MTSPTNGPSRPSHDPKGMGREVGRRETRKLLARRRRGQGVWFGLGLFGLVGWSVALPTLVGVALGVWLDRNWPGRVSWTLTLLLVGLALGSLNAWFWFGKEREDMERDRKNDNHQ